MSYRDITRNGVDQADPLEFAKRRRITLSTTVSYRGRQLVVSAEGLDADRFCDLLDMRFGPVSAQPNGGNTPRAPGPLTSPPLCPVHKREMKPMKYPSKQGHTFHCTAKVGDDGWCDERA
jgi:hypothetical protein